MTKTSVEVWKVMDIESLPNVEMEVGTFPKIREFALSVYDNIGNEKYKRAYIENANEQVIFSFLGEYNFEVKHVCDVKIDEFNVKQKDYTTSI